MTVFANHREETLSLESSTLLWCFVTTRKNFLLQTHKHENFLVVFGTAFKEESVVLYKVTFRHGNSERVPVVMETN